MRILIFGIHYYPDLTGIGKYTGEMASWLAGRGHEVFVITGKPFYPQWEVSKEYRTSWWIKETIDKVNVTRCPLYVPKNPKASRKIIHECSFLLGVFPVWIRLLFMKKMDVVFSINPPFHLSIYPLLYKYLRGAKMVSHVQDLQVDVVKDLGMIKNSRLISLMFQLEKFFFKQSDLISTISKGMERKIAHKGVERKKQKQFPNWVDGEFIRPMARSQSLRKRFGLEEDVKVVMYAGNLGEKQGLEMIIEAAKKLQNRPDIQFLIVGNGGAKKRLVKLAESKKIKNIKFLPLQPYSDLPNLLATPDLHLVLQKKKASDLVMPSKLTGILAAGGCALVTAAPGTSLHDLVAQHNMGILINPESLDDLVSGILFSLSMDTGEIVFNARSYSMNFLQKEPILKEMEKHFFSLVGGEYT